MEFKKRLAILLAAVICTATLAGCSTADNENPSQEEDETSITEESSLPEESSEEEPEEESSEPEESSQQDQSSQPDTSQSDEQSQTSAAQAQAESPATNAVIVGPFDWNTYGYADTLPARVGTQDELDTFRATLAGLSPQSVTTVAMAAQPNDYQDEYVLSPTELAEFLVLLGTLQPGILPVEELGNPFTGGGWSVYIQGSVNMIVSHGGWITVCYAGTDETLIFSAPDITAFLEVQTFIWSRMDENYLSA